jgi:hypothetical protein
LTAITRHHHAAANGYRAWRGHSAAPAAFREALAVVGLDDDPAGDVWWTPDGVENLSSLLIEFDLRKSLDIWLYLLLVRVLRLADQRSQIR